MDGMTIGEVARRAGVKTSALRYYEEVGILPPPRRVNGRRRYDPVAVRMLDVLRFAQRAGFTLEEIRTLFHGFGAETPLSERWEALARAKLRELDELIERAARMRRAIETGLGCGCVRLEDCVVGVPCDPAEAAGPATERSGKLPDLLASLPRLSEAEVDAFASDLDRARAEIPPLMTDDPVDRA